MSEDSGTVIIGGGLAGATTASQLRELGYDRPVTIVAAESHPPYERPPLSKGLLQGNEGFDDALVHERDWYKAHDVSLETGVSVTNIDRSSQHVTTSNGRDRSYDTLVIATGATSRPLDIPGSDLDGVHLLRTVDESETLRATFEAGGRLAIIGAGWIGLEVASSARQAGMEVAVVAPNAVPLEHVLGPVIGEHFERVHRDHGVDFFMGVSVEAIIDRNGRAAGLRTSAGEVVADAVLVAIGAIPDTTLATNARLAVENGILVDKQMRTSDQRILAIGDVANAEHETLGRLRVEHWDNAIRQGTLAASTIVGSDETYDWQPYFFTDQFDLGMEYVGRASSQADVTIRGDMASNEFIAFWRDDGVVTAAMNVNIWDVNEALRGMLGRRIDSAILAREDIPVEEIARAGSADA